MKLGVFSKIFLCVFVTVSIFSFVENYSYAQGPTSGAAASMYTPEAVKTEAAAKAAQEAADKAARAAGNCPTWDVGCHFSKAIREAVGQVAAFTLQGGAAVLGWFGSVFDVSIKETVISAGDKFSSGSKGVYYILVSDIWKIFRDIANVIVIFSLLYLAIKTILEGNGFADKKTLSGVLIAATLINFSLFFTKLAFDVSNKIGVAVYSQIVASPDYSDGSLSSGVMKIVNLEGLINTLKSSTGGWEDIIKALISALFMCVLMIVLAFIFVSAAVLLLYRFFIFIFLMISSPIGIVSKFIPWMSSIGSMWWDQLRKQVIVLPAFFVTLYVGLYAAGTIFKAISTSMDMGKIDLFANKAAAVANADTMGSYLVSFILLVFFLGASLIVPGLVGAKGSEMMTSAGKKLKGYGESSLKWAKRSAGTATLGTGAVVARATVGGLSRGVLKRDFIKNTAQRSGIIGGIARKTLGGADYLGNKATYDARNVKVGGKALGEEFGIGKGISGYKETFDKKKKEEEDNKQRVMKLTGLDKAAKNDPNVKTAKTALDVAMTDRDASSEELINAKSSLKTAIAAGDVVAQRTIKADIKRIEIERKTANEILTEMQTKVKNAEERAEMFAGAKYANIAHSKMNRVFNVARGDMMRNSATKDMVVDMEKSWFKDKKRSRVATLKGELTGMNYKLRDK